MLGMKYAQRFLLGHNVKSTLNDLPDYFKCFQNEILFKQSIFFPLRKFLLTRVAKCDIQC